MPPFLPLLLAATLASGCAMRAYEAQPLDPTAAASQWRQRSLGDPDLLSWIDRVRASPKEEIEVWGLPELTLAGLYLHPDLDIARARLRAAEAAERSAGLPRNPRVSPQIQHHSKADGISPWSLWIGLEIPVRSGDHQAALRDHSAALTEAVRMELGTVVWQIRSRLRAAWVEHLAAQAHLALLRREAGLRGDALRIVDARRGAGMASRDEVSEARVQLGSAMLAQATAIAASDKTLAALAAAVGLPASALKSLALNAAGLSLVAGQLPADDVQQAAMRNRIDLQLGLARYAAAESRLRLEIAKQVPDITLDPGFFFDQGDRVWSLGASLLLALFERNEGPIAEAEAQREIEGRRFLALQARVLGELAATLQGYRHALVELGAARDAMRTHEAQLAASERRVAAGYDDRLDLLRPRLESVRGAKALLAAEIATQRALGALEDAVQQPLDGSAPLPDVSAGKDPS